MSVLGALSPTLVEEDGKGFGFVCIWRPGETGEPRHGVTVGEWLSRPENQEGTWLIDGGWGGPPGPIHVRWNGGAWESGGFCGARFKEGGGRYER